VWRWSASSGIARGRIESAQQLRATARLVYDRAMTAVRSLLIAVVCAVLQSLAAAVPRAAAQTGVVDMSGMSDEQAKSHFKVGKTLYEAGRFAEAAVEFEKAYALSNKEPLLYNIYVAYRDASDLPHAIDALRRYLDSAKLELDERVNLQARLRAMEDANARTEAARAAAPEPAPAPEVAAPAPAPVAPAPAPAPAPAAPAAPPARSSSPVPYVLAIGGGTLILGGVVTGLVASSKINGIEDDCEDDTCPKGYGLDDKRSDARTWRTLAFVLTGAGVVTAAIGAVLLLAQGGDAESPPVAAALDCGPSGCRVHGRF
jgi:tetratricopeptide (TPR) repeat protein